MKVLICGGRDYNNQEMVDYFLNLFNPSVVVNGGAKGADQLSSYWAHCNDVQQFIYDAKWEEHGKAAGPIRNKQMLDLHPDIDLVIGFAGGKGTADMLKQAQERGLLTLHVR